MSTALAKRKKESTDLAVASAGTRKFCSFRLAGRLFGVDILHIKEVTSELVFTPIHHAPPCIKGYVNIRGQINLVVDMKQLLGFEPKPVDSDSRVILFKTEVGESFGVLVDKIGDIIETDESRIERKETKRTDMKDDLQEKLSELEDGICKLEKDLMTILNPSKILGVIMQEN